jgi:hypothetical protein
MEKFWHSPTFHHCKTPLSMMIAFGMPRLQMIWLYKKQAIANLSFERKPQIVI